MSDEQTTGAERRGEDRQRSGRSASPAAGASRKPHRLAREGPRQSHGPGPISGEAITLRLTNAQAREVLRSAGRQGPMSVLLAALWDPDWTLSMAVEGDRRPWQLDDPGLSRSLLNGLMVFACFRPGGSYRGVAEIAHRLDMTRSTTHRYITTLVAAGLLEREPARRKYRSARST